MSGRNYITMNLATEPQQLTYYDNNAYGEVGLLRVIAEIWSSLSVVQRTKRYVIMLAALINFPPY